MQKCYSNAANAGFIKLSTHNMMEFRYQTFKMKYSRLHKYMFQT